MNRGRFVRRVVLGIAALTLWLVFFCGGLLLETVQYRAFLAPSSFPKQAAANRPGDGTAAANADGKAAAIQPYQGSSTFAFLAAALWFTPTNLAFLALLAGLLGGCASNVLVADLSEEEADKIHPESLRYLAEAPWSAMMRSFIVYLCVIAGLYFAIDDPFKDSTPAQYMRLAGTVSILALLVGYDPSRIRSWIGLVPSPQSQRVTVTKDQQGEVTLEAAQGPLAATASGHEPPAPESALSVTIDSLDGDSEPHDRKHRIKKGK